MPVWILAGVLLAGSAPAAGPLYSEAGLLNGANFAAGPFAPNSIVSLFGSNLAWSEETLSPGNTGGGSLPDHLAGARVFVANLSAPLLYVGPSQINFLIPGNLRPGEVMVRVVRQGVTGPEVPLTLVDAAPQIFQTEDGYAIAQHGEDYSRITGAAPARAGEIIVIYLTGLGHTEPDPLPGEIPTYPGRIARPDGLQLYLDAAPLSPQQILYAGLTPGSAGVYQINAALPEDLGPDPEIRVAVDHQISIAGLKLATILQPQRSDPAER
ncbi:MAG TPA: hypothetical protein VJ732_13215 [Bryobacteraceae bacterium]|nr:hypothetical protein [Bryobacteraceae bacterium]